MDLLAKKIIKTIETCKKHPQQECAWIFTAAFSQPSAAFEEKYGFKDIARHYRLPQGLSPVNLQIYTLLLRERKDLFSEAQRLKKMQEIWAALVRRNPSLKKINGAQQDTSTLFGLLMGVASAFNTKDMQHFISAGHHPAQKMWESPAYKKLEKVFNKYASRRNLSKKLKGDLPVYWVACPETLQLIQDKLMHKRCMRSPVHTPHK